MKDLNDVRNVLLIALGIFSAAFGLKGFLLPNHFIDGGVTGISMLSSSVLGISFPLLLVVLNLPFVALGYKQIGKTFAIKSSIAILGLALCIFFISFPSMTYDKILTAVFGGLFLGAGIGLSIRGGAVLDGTEIAALLASRKSHILRVGDFILILNVFIFLSAAIFLGVEPAMYSIVTYVAASRTIQFLIHGVEEYTAITIISQKSEEIKDAIIGRLQRGVTVFRGTGGMGSTGIKQEDHAILYCVVTRLEIGAIKSVINEIDGAAFVTIHPLSDVAGGLIKRNVLH